MMTKIEDLYLNLKCEAYSCWGNYGHWLLLGLYSAGMILVSIFLFPLLLLCFGLLLLFIYLYYLLVLRVDEQKFSREMKNDDLCSRLDSYKKDDDNRLEN